MVIYTPFLVRSGTAPATTAIPSETAVGQVREPRSKRQHHRTSS
jgi:hypothetical protein